MKKVVIKKEVVEEKKAERKLNDSWIYMVLLSTLVILAESLKTYVFNIDSIQLTYSIFLLPFQYFLVNYIVKKYDYKDAFKAILLSAGILVLFVFVMDIAVNRNFIFADIGGEFIGYLFSQFVNLMIYYFLMNNTKSSFILIYLTYLFDVVVYYLFYMILSFNMIIVNTFWVAYFSTLLLQAIIFLLLTFLDTQIKRGSN